MSKVQLLRQAKKQGYRIDCPIAEDDSTICAECEAYGFCVHDGVLNKKKVDAYIKRYSRKREVKKSFTTDRPNFRKALKDKKEFRVYPKDIETLKELVVSSGVRRAIIGRSLNEFIADANGIKFCHSSNEPIEYLVFATARNKVDLPEYNPETDTFSDHLPEVKKKEESDCKPYPVELISSYDEFTLEVDGKKYKAILEKEYNRLKKIEEDYILIKKVLED